MTTVAPYPLAWPTGVPRTPSIKRIRSPFRTGFALTLKAAAEEATRFLVGDPANGIPLRSPMPHEIQDHILSLAAQVDKSNG